MNKNICRQLNREIQRISITNQILYSIYRWRIQQGVEQRERKSCVTVDTYFKKSIKTNYLSANTHKNRLLRDYQQANNGVKKAARRNKCLYINNLAQQVQTTTEKGDSRALCCITKH